MFQTTNTIHFDSCEFIPPSILIDVAPHLSLLSSMKPRAIRTSWWFLLESQEKGKPFRAPDSFQISMSRSSKFGYLGLEMLRKAKQNLLVSQHSNGITRVLPPSYVGLSIPSSIDMYHKP